MRSELNRWLCRVLVLAGALVATSPVRAQAPALSFAGNGYDFVVFVAQTRQAVIAIDPEAAQELSQVRIELAGDNTPVVALLKAQLPANKFVIKPIEFGADAVVQYVTTAEGAAYLEAMGQLKRGQVVPAYNTLKTVTGDSPLARHCAAFVRACDALGQRNQLLNRLEPDIRQRAENFSRALKDLELAKMAAASSTRGSSSVAGFAADRHEQALAEGRKAWERLDEFARGLVDGNQPTRECLAQARAWGLQTEARFLYEQLVESGLRLRRLLALMKAAKLAESEEDYNAVPEAVKELRAKYTELTAEADRRSGVAVKLVKLQPPVAEEEFLRAYDADRACPQARVGYGYVQVQRSARALQAVFGTDRDATVRGEQLQKEWGDREKRGMLLALYEHRRQALPSSLPPRTKTGSTRGLVVADGKGELFPVAVRIETIRQPAAEAVRSNFWGSLLAQKLEEQNLPVSFGDYGAKDPFMLLSATEAYKWLRSIDGTFRDSTGLKIGFHELFGGKAGDSAGVTIAVSGYSELRRIGIRQDVAMTGSVRADGGVKAVGGVPLKIAGAVAAAEVEVVIVPRENEPDLMALSVEQLCRVAVITADDVSTYLKYACAPAEDNDQGKNAAAQRQAWQALLQLRQGQLRLLLGDWKGAVEPLAAVAGHREVYNARRLLELLQARLLADGNTGAAAEVKKQIQAAQSLALLGATKQYEVAVQRDQVVFTDTPTTETEPPKPAKPVTTAQPATPPEVPRLKPVEPKDPLSNWGPLVGTWVIRYSNGASRAYTITEDGWVRFPGENLKGQLKLLGRDVVLQFQGDGRMERLKLLPDGRLEVLHFNPATDYPKRPNCTGTGVRR